MGERPESDRTAADRTRVREAWDANAAYWDREMGEGNAFHRYLLMPHLERLVHPQPGDRILEIACGNGQLARWMSSRGASVLAVDASEQMVALARAKPPSASPPIDFRVVDACDAEALAGLPGPPFSAVVCNMALMDMPETLPLARSLPLLLASEGRFVFSVCHPCFNTSDSVKVARFVDDGPTPEELHGVEVTRYATPRQGSGVAMLGQPSAQPYFERSLSLLLAPFLGVGLVVDALEEPVFPPGAPDRGRWFSWTNFPEIPPALVVRMTPGGRWGSRLGAGAAAGPVGQTL